MDIKDIELHTIDFLKSLYDQTGYFSNGDIKDGIIEVQNYLKNNPESIVCDMLLKPFLIGVNCEGKLKAVSLDFLIYI